MRARFTRLERWLGMERLCGPGAKAPKDYKRPKMQLARSTKLRIYHEQDGLCYLCKKPMTVTPEAEAGANIQPRDLDATWDHIHPLILGGKNNLSNLALAHLYPCNIIKGQLPSLDLTTEEGRDRAIAFHLFLVQLHTLQPLRRVI